MSLRIYYAPWFDADNQFRVAWYAEKGGVTLAERFVAAVERTVNQLAENPNRGRRRYPRDPDLADIYAVRVARPFQKHLLYYRFNEDTLFLERLIHGARDLPGRLRESPYEED
jgi:plasmid stabilization system protein ParE